MKKIYLTVGITAVLLCFHLLFVNAETIGDVEKKMERTTGTASVVKGGKVLVAYFTSPETDGVDANSGASRIVVHGKLYGSTEHIANLIRQATGGDLFAIKTVDTYPGTHKALVDAAKKEEESKARPKLATHIKNLGDYDVIFVGYPNWWYDMPMPIYTFFDEYDFSGKTVIPFCTHGGSRFSQSVQTITAMEKKAQVIKGPSISRDNVSEARQNILKWLQEKGFASNNK